MHSRLDIALAVTGEGTRAAPSISSWVKQEGDQVKFRTLLRLFSFFLFFFFDFGRLISPEHGLFGQQETIKKMTDTICLSSRGG